MKQTDVIITIELVNGPAARLVDKHSLAEQVIVTHRAGDSADFANKLSEIERRYFTDGVEYVSHRGVGVEKIHHVIAPSQIAFISSKLADGENIGDKFADKP